MSSVTRDSHRNGQLFDGLRERFPGLEAEGPAFWRSLDELAGSPEFEELLHQEFPEGATELSGVERRSFLKMMGASLAFAGLTACTRQPVEKIVPHVKAPEDVIPGKPLFYATAHVHAGYATGILVESHGGRPTKVEGNPEHPASLGATDVYAQASVLSLYDPERSHTVRRAGQISTWERFVRATALELERQKVTKGAGFRILTETVTSPTLHSQISALLAKFPEARWHQFEPVNRDQIKLGSQQSFGRMLEPVYDLEQADVILSLDADFLSRGPRHLVDARTFAKRRRADRMNRLYVAEPSPTNTGASADHRVPVAAGSVEAFAREVAFQVGLPVEGGDADGHETFVEAVVEDLKSAGKTALVIAGEDQSPAVHAIAHEINATLGSLGSTVKMMPTAEAEPVIQSESIRSLVEDLDNDAVDLLLVVGGNPMVSVPAGLDFEQAFLKAQTRVHLSDRFDETSRLCDWHIPEAHALETWSDARALTGEVTIVQPLIEPLYGGRSPHEVLSLYLGEAGKDSYSIVKGFWQRERGGTDFETFWQTSLHDGIVADTGFSSQDVKTNGLTLDTAKKTQGLQLSVRPDANIWDGRYANNGWLQELPKPLTRLTWENAILIAPATADAQGLASGDIVQVIVPAGETGSDLLLDAPVWVQPGQDTDTLTLHLGYGRTHTGKVGNGMGVSAARLSRSSIDVALSVRIAATGRRAELASTQDHSSMEGRDLVRVGTLEEYQQDPGFAHHGHHAFGDELSMYDPEEHKHDGYQWGMAIDLNACTGCNACTIACQSENNIPVVGKDQVADGREMHWVRVDRYYKGSSDDPEIYHQPVPCMHCENAPCEVVCPVNATVHGEEGLNEMVYNRCVGTRYCSNNCPYKVRRFNFLQYVDEETESYKLMRNPDVTVRARGVMEKCTFCVQRINATRITAKTEDREIRDGEVVTACAQVCPTEAIVFGDISDPESRVSKMKADQRNYGLLETLNTKSRTTYLAKLRNPNPKLEASEPKMNETHHHG